MGTKIAHHPNFSNQELWLMDYTAVEGKDATMMGMEPRDQPVVTDDTPQANAAKSSGYMMSSSAQTQLLAAVVVLGAIWWLR